MSGLTLFARLVLRLANWIAGPAREEWVLAMASETDAAGRGGTGWAFGCLGAALRDRLARDWGFYAAMAILPVLAFAAIMISLLVIFVVDRIVGLISPLAVAIMLLTPLPIPWAIGRMRPSYSPVVVGSLSFLAFEAGPMIAMAIMSGRPLMPWSPNFTVNNLPAWAGLTLGYAAWLAAVWLGAASRRTSTTPA